MPEIYIECISAAVEGLCHETWIDCGGKDADTLIAEIDLFLSQSPAISKDYGYQLSDYQDWEGIEIRENEDIGIVALLTEELAEHGIAFVAFWKAYGDRLQVMDQFEDYYQGCFEDEEDFIRQTLEDQGILTQAAKIGLPHYYIDFDAIANDWFVNDYLSISIEGDCYIFRKD